MLFQNQPSTQCTSRNLCHTPRNFQTLDCVKLNNCQLFLYRHCWELIDSQRKNKNETLPGTCPASCMLCYVHVYSCLVCALFCPRVSHACMKATFSARVRVFEERCNRKNDSKNNDIIFAYTQQLGTNFGIGFQGLGLLWHAAQLQPFLDRLLVLFRLQGNFISQLHKWAATFMEYLIQGSNAFLLCP